MQFNLEGITINSEEDFLKLIEQINTDIEFDYYFKKDKPAEKLLDKKYLITRYRALAAKEKRKLFREEDRVIVQRCLHAYLYPASLQSSVNTRCRFYQLENSA